MAFAFSSFSGVMILEWTEGDSLEMMIEVSIVLSSEDRSSTVVIKSLSLARLNKACIQVLHIVKLSSVSRGIASIVVFRMVGLIRSMPASGFFESWKGGLKNFQ